MSSRFLIVVAAVVAVQFAYAADPPATPELWYFHSSYLTNASAVQSSEALIDRAVTAGYTGVALFDSSFSFMAAPFWPAQNVSYMQQVMAYASSKGLKVLATVAPYGHSNDALENNTNWAESQRVVGTQYRVDPTGHNLELINSVSQFANHDFSQGKTGWFDMNDEGVDFDPNVTDGSGGSGSIANASNNARLRQTIGLTPWRQYHLHFSYKTSDFQGYPALYVFDSANFSKVRLNAYYSAIGSHDWQDIDYVFNSQNTTKAYLYLGVWGGCSGTIWYDNITIEETGLIYATRRSGSPVTVYDPNNPSIVFQENTDYNYISDPAVTNQRAFDSSPFQNDLPGGQGPQYAGPKVTLSSGTHLLPGQIVAIDSYSIFPEPGAEHQAGLCLTESGVLNWLTNNAEAIATILPAGGGFFMQYDEMRQMNSCAGCKAKGLTPGQLLAWHVQQSAQVYTKASANAPLYVWSDMFDPNHNAVSSSYFSVEGDLTGSWKGLAPSVTVMNWNLGNLNTSLTFFSGQTASQPTAYNQIIAGYYDSGNGAATAQSELAQSSGVNGVQGLMYTTWNADYSQLEQFASAAKAAWPAYIASLNGPPIIPVGYVSIVSRDSGKCLETYGISTTPGDKVDQWDCWGGSNQLWQVIPIGDGAYQVQVQSSGLALDVVGGPSATANGTSLQQSAYLGNSNQQWKLQAELGGYFRFVVQNSGKCLDVAGQSKQNGAKVQVWSCWSGENQQWKLVPAP